MDCVFNKQIPKSEAKRIILRPTSKTFISGIAQSYDTTYPEQLKDYISEREYSYVINRIVDELSMMWPCCFCFSYGYIFCLCTLGFSFMFPQCCIEEAKIKLLECIKEMNVRVLNKKRLEMSYQQKCSTSWLQIDVIDKDTLKSEDAKTDNSEIEDNQTNANQNYLIKNQIN